MKRCVGFHFRFSRQALPCIPNTVCGVKLGACLCLSRPDLWLVTNLSLTIVYSVINAAPASVYQRTGPQMMDCNRPDDWAFQRQMCSFCQTCDSEAVNYVSLVASHTHTHIHTHTRTHANTHTHTHAHTHTYTHTDTHTHTHTHTSSHTHS